MPNVLFAGDFEVTIHVRTEIDDGSHANGIIAEPIGKFGDAVGLDSFKRGP